MQRWIRTIFLALLPLSSVCADDFLPPQKCLDCHGDLIVREEYFSSVHGTLSCTGCHAGIEDLSAHGRGKGRTGPVSCGSCHRRQFADYAGSIHRKKDIECTGCHAAVHAMTARTGNKKPVVEACGFCHETDWYEQSVHGQAVSGGSTVAPACHDCHGLHNVGALKKGSEGYNEFKIEVCLQCHADRQLMQRSGIFPLAVSAYERSYHGKSYRLGFPKRVAVCADCHTRAGTAHGILPAEDERGSIHPANRTSTCGRCHEGIDADFATFHVHATWRAPERYPIEYWAYTLMTTLLVTVFVFFWSHTLLWLVRGAVEKRNLENEYATGKRTPMRRGHIHYYRFRPIHIILHIIVIISFLGLSFTGLPLKFAGMEWADSMMRFYGGPRAAGFVHRICAVLTFGYFIAALFMSFHFLFLRRDLKGNWVQRLFGPESLMFNRKDARDLAGMIKWFLFLGGKPRFERWSYWEKFDFFAVFWGMFVIGGSGLMLWHSEFFGSILGGWTLNIARIIHSEEALLATGFIFTVHFFNTHGRPEKFPMDFVIFNGEISRHDFVVERGAQWERYEQKGVIEQYRVRKSSGIVYDILFRAFGYLCVLTGLFIAFLLLYAFLRIA
jgi:cytochrome b subunit of formate dehydrogenase